MSDYIAWLKEGRKNGWLPSIDEYAQLQIDLRTEKQKNEEYKRYLDYLKAIANEQTRRGE